ncbi:MULTISPECIES: hypothetical protein [Amycolatopsis]|uniref:hypothetical protein n=1 Tax=Amycolatopsis TaxID=1813 RepID=UPI000B1A2B99|nr:MULTISPECIES: hypothetical protein [Amycolatopsis]MYW92869.1 hypothetical protein [Amycolatopsis rubida]
MEKEYNVVALRVGDYDVDEQTALERYAEKVEANEGTATQTRTTARADYPASMTTDRDSRTDRIEPYRTIERLCPGQGRYADAFDAICAVVRR